MYRRTVEMGLYSSWNIRSFIEYSLDRVENALKYRKVAILRAPPGIGKTAVPMTILLAILRGYFPYASSVIHVAPMRSLIDDLADRIRKSLAKLVGDRLSMELVARQHGFAHETYGLMAPYTITTFDTYLYNFYKLPTDEIIKIYEGSYGHYEVPRSSILSALNFLDEVHMAIEEGSIMANAVAESIRALASFKVPTVISTATLSSYLLKHIVGLVGRNSRRNSIEIIDYEEYLNTYGADDFYLVESNKIFKPLAGNPLIKVRDLCGVDEEPLRGLVRELLDSTESGYRVSIVVNTVEIAKCIYLKLKDRGNVILIHSRFNPKDRLDKIQALKSGRGVLLVSTQVLEVGVDIGFDAMISQISPPSSLIQRMGRLARGEKSEGRWAIFTSDVDLASGSGIYPPNIVNITWEILSSIVGSGEKINWHLPKSIEGGFRGYMDILDNVWASGSWKKPSLGSESFFKALTSPLIASEEVFNLLKTIGGFRDENICSLYIYERDVSELLDIRNIWSRSIPISCEHMLSYIEKAIGKGYNIYILKRRKASYGSFIGLDIDQIDLKKLENLKEELRRDPLSFIIKYLGAAIPSTLYDGGVHGIGLKDM